MERQHFQIPGLITRELQQGYQLAHAYPASNEQGIEQSWEIQAG